MSKPPTKHNPRLPDLRGTLAKASTSQYTKDSVKKTPLIIQKRHEFVNELEQEVPPEMEKIADVLDKIVQRLENLENGSQVNSGKQEASLTAVKVEHLIEKPAKESRGDHEKDFLQTQLKQLETDGAQGSQTYKNIQARLNTILKSELFGWKATENVKKALELGMDEDEIKLYAAMQSLKMGNSKKSSKPKQSKPWKKKGGKGGKKTPSKKKD
jgi:cell division protein ZapA (FtsZ GTPase activity inhibitor)